MIIVNWLRLHVVAVVMNKQKKIALILERHFEAPINHEPSEDGLRPFDREKSCNMEAKYDTAPALNAYTINFIAF